MFYYTHHTNKTMFILNSMCAIVVCTFAFVHVCQCRTAAACMVEEAKAAHNRVVVVTANAAII